MTIGDVHMAKEVVRAEELGKGMIEVPRSLTVERDDMMEVESEEVHGRGWKCAGVEGREGKVMKEGVCGAMEKGKGSALKWNGKS